MAGNRVYIPFTLFNIRIVNMKHLWEPSREYLGKPTDKPNYFITGVTAKTKQNWWEEPTLAPAWAAYSQLLQASGMTPQMVAEWPIKDGDMPAEPGKPPSEWAKDHWVLGGSTSSAIKVELVQGQNVVLLANKVGVKPGDYTALGLSAAIKQNNARGLKHYCNTVLFMAPGEEIAVGQSVSGAELMQQAQAQGLNVAGFHSAPGFGGQPGGGFPSGAGVPVTQPGFPSTGAPSNPPMNGGPQGQMGAPMGGGAFAGPAPTGTPGLGHGSAPFPSSGGAFPAGPAFPQ